MEEQHIAKKPNAFEQLKDQYILEKHRIESFKSWPFSETSTCSKLKMAQAGWYWTGTQKEPDTATCFLCHKTLDGWEETDEPWTEHSKHAPRCLFVKLGRPENDLSVVEFLDVYQSILADKASKHCEKLKADVKDEAAKELKKFMH